MPNGAAPNSRGRHAALSVAAALLALVGATRLAGAQAPDHYVLALSWSPTYCETADPRRDRLQCDPEADRGFIVHGLWPNRGEDAPAFCPSRAADPSDALVASMLDIMPSRGLVRHQWEKHGTCSGLDADAYFRTVRAAFDSVRIPGGLAAPTDDFDVQPGVLREAFRRANPGLSDEAITVSCPSRQLREVRICLDTDLSFRECPAVARRRCRTRLIEVPAPE
ncbi:ribonuclease T2 family protein [Acuticoccus sp.]|uniref:ribonuclease T2 family protein n=1 Tax=Acuticoccus sp. TaxID=1904378 RepID=UPI003B523960